MRITTILWDIDGTLLDFRVAEKAAIRACLKHFAMPDCTDAQIARYAEINHRHWKAIEAGLEDKPHALVARFADFFAAEGITADAAAFNREYQARLGETFAFHDGADALVRSLRGRVVQAAVTNGTPVAQHAKLKNSGLDQILDAIFISEEVGAEKPSALFFAHVMAALGHPDPQSVAIVGDSLTSDMAGGLAAGLHTVWYNPEGAANTTPFVPEFEIADLNAVAALLGLDRQAP